ncbi:MAG: biotin/lipoyl-binding protein [Gemmataceae bacterium]|nr:biotin/lipoyl-binding protein [Gemmataceae bacterium]
MELRLPELGEGIVDATVVNVPVKAGQPVKTGDTVIEVETDKASMPIPATADGTISEVRVKAGDKIKVGALIAIVGEKAASAAPAAKPAGPPLIPPAAVAKPQVAPTGQREFALPNLGEGIESGIIVAVNVKVGDTVTAGQEMFTIETDKASMPLPADADGKIEELRVKQGDKVNIGAVLAVLSGAGSPTQSMKRSEAPASNGQLPAPVVAKPEAVAPVTNGQATTVPPSGPVPAGPATRRYAREHGVNLTEVPGSARGGRVTVPDVQSHIRHRLAQPGGISGGAVTIPTLPDFSRYGPIEKKPVSNIRKKIAENLTIAWHTAPAVTQFDLADITELEAGRKRITEGLPKGAPKVTMTVLAIKAIVAALKEFPNFNSSLDVANGQVIYKQYYHIGIAVDTERGLVVPVIRDADRKSIRDLASEVASLAEKARTAKLAIDEMRGGTFTITNLGGIGGTAFTPIINYPEVAILGLSRAAIQPVHKDGQFVPRLMMPLCLTYDHRIIDGADGARFTTRLVQLFSDPIRLLMES